MEEKNKKLAILDINNFLYKIGSWANNSDNFQEYKDILKERLLEILKAVGATHYIAVIDGKTVYRQAIDSSYKGHRKYPYIKFKADCREYMIKDLQCTVSDIIEADDLVCILSDYHKHDYDIVICHDDKDYLQLPDVQQYNIRTQEFIKLDKTQARLNLFKQVLTGDSSDGYKGKSGFGDAAWNAFLEKVDYNVSLSYQVLKVFIFGLSKDKYNIKRVIGGDGEPQGITNFALNYKMARLLRSIYEVSNTNELTEYMKSVIISNVENTPCISVNALEQEEEVQW